LSAGDVAEVPAVELDASARVGDALHHLLRTSQEAFPLVSEGELRGVVLRAELLRAAGRPELRLHSIRTLAQRVPELPSQLSAAEALKLLEELDAPLGVVITPDYPLGFISRAQVLSKLAQLPTSHWPPPPGSRPGLGAPGANPQGPRMAGRDEGAY
jgi:predicted transcriptional regulator